MQARRGVTTGPVVVLVGPEGGVKAAVAAELAKRLPRPVRSVDLTLRWLLRARSAVRDGGTVIFARGWWDPPADPPADPRRRRAAPPWLLAALGRLLPRSTVTVVLTAGPDTPPARAAGLRGGPLRATVVDARAPLDQVVARIERAVRERAVRERTARRAAGRGAGGWVALPRTSAPRWTLPVTPRAAAASGMLIHQPMSTGALVAWRAARAFAAAGGLRLLPNGAAPPDAVREVIGRHAPADSVLALVKSNHEARWTAMVLAPDGRVRGVAKVALDAEGRRSLAVEADATERFPPLMRPTSGPGPGLASGLRTPRLLVRADDLLLFEAVPWIPRARPWLLPPAVAFGMGTLFASAGDPTGGPAHGDFAPWNLLRGRSAWYLIDWADARERAEPFTDVFHHLVQSHALLGRPDRDDLLAGLDGRGWVGAALRAYAEGAGLPPAAARDHLPGYLERSAVGLNPAKADARRGLRARQELSQALRARALRATR